MAPAVRVFSSPQTRCRPEWLALTVCVCLAGCDDSSPPATASPEIQIVAQATILPREDEGETPFGRIADIELDANGHVYVLDELARSIRVFDAEGAELRSFGKRGEGPGELERPAHLFWGPRGHLWVLDRGNGRLTAFSTDGELLGTALPTGFPMFFPMAVGFAGDGTLRWVGATSPDLANLTAGWVKSELSDGEIRLLEEEPLPFVEWPVLFEHRTEDMVFAVPVPFGGEPQYAFDADGQLWYAHTASPLVHRVTDRGEVDLSINVYSLPIAVSGSDREEAMASPELDEVRSVGASAVQELAALIPAVHPPLEGFFLDDLGRIWVIGSPNARSIEGNTMLQVYDPSGAAVGQAQVNLTAQPRPRMRSGVLAAVVRDELDVESIATYLVGERTGGT